MSMLFNTVAIYIYILVPHLLFTEITTSLPTTATTTTITPITTACNTYTGKPTPSENIMKYYTPTKINAMKKYI